MCFDLFAFLDLNYNFWTFICLFLNVLFFSLICLNTFRNSLMHGDNCQNLSFTNSILLSIAFSILGANIAGLAPYTYIFSGHLFLGLCFGFGVWLSGVLASFCLSPLSFMSHLAPLGAPLILGPVLCMMEMCSELIRPLALVLRLCANMTAGHILCGLCSFIWVSLGILFPFELGVGFIQALVFAGLLSMYVS